MASKEWFPVETSLGLVATEPCRVILHEPEGPFYPGPACHGRSARRERPISGSGGAGPGPLPHPAVRPAAGGHNTPLAPGPRAPCPFGLGQPGRRTLESRALGVEGKAD